MKKLLIAALLALLPAAAFAQTVTQQPQFVAPRAIVDLGNAPLEVLPITGNGGIFTSQGSGVGSGTTTSITLTATPTTPPCIGCFISGGTLIATSIVTAFNGTTTITTNTSQTVAASTALTWGAACPVSTQAAPNNGPLPPMALLQTTFPPWGFPVSGLSRVCAYGATGPGMQFATFPIGAH